MCCSFPCKLLVKLNGCGTLLPSFSTTQAHTDKTSLRLPLREAFHSPFSSPRSLTIFFYLKDICLPGLLEAASSNMTRSDMQALVLLCVLHVLYDAVPAGLAGFLSKAQVGRDKRKGKGAGVFLFPTLSLTSPILTISSRLQDIDFWTDSAPGKALICLVFLHLTVSCKVWAVTRKVKVVKTFSRLSCRFLFSPQKAAQSGEGGKKTLL